MIYVFLGVDFNVLNSKVNELISSLNISNIIKYDYSESNIEEILDEINYVDLFNEKKLIIVSSFSFKKLKDREEELLKKYIENMNSNILIFKCLNETLDERKQLTKLLREKCKIIEIKKLDYKSLHEYVSNILKENGIEASFNQIKKILDICEYNPDYTINEVEKLLLYKIGESKLYDKDIDDVISKNNEKEMFNFIDNVLKKDVTSSLKSFKLLISGNIDEVIILDNISKQYRLLMQVKILNDNMSESDISKKLKVNPYVIKKIIPYIKSYSIDEISNKLCELSDMDIKIKSFGFDKTKVLESFLISL